MLPLLVTLQPLEVVTASDPAAAAAAVAATVARGVWVFCTNASAAAS